MIVRHSHTKASGNILFPQLNDPFYSKVAMFHSSPKLHYLWISRHKQAFFPQTYSRVNLISSLENIIRRSASVLNDLKASCQWKSVIQVWIIKKAPNLKHLWQCRLLWSSVTWFFHRPPSCLSSPSSATLILTCPARNLCQRTHSVVDTCCIFAMWYLYVCIYVEENDWTTWILAKW